MAITYQAGSVYIDTTGLAISGKCKISQIIFTSANKADSATLIDNTSGATPVKLVITGSSTESTRSIVFPVPMMFTAGVYCSALSAGTSVTLITAFSGE